jgi:hypothetical protein
MWRRWAKEEGWNIVQLTSGIRRASGKLSNKVRALAGGALLIAGYGHSEKPPDRLDKVGDKEGRMDVCVAAAGSHLDLISPNCPTHL